MKLKRNDLRMANAVAEEKSRPALCCVLLRRGKLVAASAQNSWVLAPR